MNRRILLMLAAALGVAVAAPATFAAWPERPIKLVVPYTPGGSTDQFGRALAEGMTRGLKQPVVVENRPGANTMVGTQSVARAQPDGYTVLMGTSASMVLNPLLYKKTGYDPKDFKVILIGIEVPLVVVTNNQVQASNLKDFAAYAKAAGGKLNYSSVGLGNPLQLATEMLKSELGIDMTHVPYNGSAPALSALLANDVQLMVDVVSTSLPHIKAGKLKALAVTGRSRLEVLPNVPTVAESGHPNFHAATWFGLAVPAQTPPEAVAKLQAAASHVLTEAAFRNTFSALGLLVQAPRTQAEIDRYVAADRESWGKVIRDNHISLD
ncbi:MAG: ABC transporter substrate-binding protein [Cupriavidus sp.]|jgi:tripartite-type tricarboxylate transporter receptor subunit TctC|uniref:Bug family tripartite tricarboxylate transporter substrate binding protein n=1 Tax=Cupriavidus pauculus TaxID=82633 RepID=UPI000C3EF3BB|nr:tripartite tricarboxylate transporter substrate binding protein [Cupriavidus pauculus]KAB0602393.1 tripartite tricarboxylate transporter substrate binding protein [Cupriavidus pauculus]MBU70228.1 ABC transporter substrate-binding protein [Cupriavidus sp.]MCM3609011.1 tripartite tricarboxylate transporter substrate binding protein [Cupriavidus pauculus]UAL00943.1 tripartite tricarboxylate transporter substrate binding protein [Cupriavidus pauculus]